MLHLGETPPESAQETLQAFARYIYTAKVAKSPGSVAKVCVISSWEAPQYPLLLKVGLSTSRNSIDVIGPRQLVTSCRGSEAG